MLGRLAVVNAGELVTLRGPQVPRTREAMREVGIVASGGFFVEDGIFTFVATSNEVEDRIEPGDTVVDAGGRVVMPGFVDAHTHLVFAGDRFRDFEWRALGKSYAEIAQEGGGIRSTMRATRLTGENELLALASKRSRWMMRCGTTTAEVKSGYGLTKVDELKMLRVIRSLSEEAAINMVPTFLGLHALPPEFEGDRSGYVEMMLDEVLPQVAAENLADWADVFVEEGYFSPDDAERLAERAQNLGLGLRMHVDQMQDSGGAALAARLGAATADHLEFASESGIAALAEAGVVPVLLPGSVLGLGKTRYPNARAMIEAGLPVVVATDFNPGSSPCPSLPTTLSLACTMMGMTPEEALISATVNAAHSLGLGHEVGSIEEGKRADFVIHDAEDWRETLVYSGRETAFEVYVAGNRAL
ncbi:MAG: imidazolonepropionase [Chthonomonadaceae bacterium]|uniref:Imidazolonepropionase n=1 Tax=Candidatus Nitrosymbiomonas proteolyticus TaxID=2608984 RepID=A0A809S512_9BACT|nr:imidazolonepropionase [Candidatus Nitrosymbiomonas proteolyticus]